MCPAAVRWRSFGQKPRFLLEARWAGQDARIQRFKLVTVERLQRRQAFAVDAELVRLARVRVRLDSHSLRIREALQSLWRKLEIPLHAPRCRLRIRWVRQAEMGHAFVHRRERHRLTVAEQPRLESRVLHGGRWL